MTKQTPTRQLFVTTALPYANGNFHIGQIMEYIQADIWAQFQLMQSSKVHLASSQGRRSDGSATKKPRAPFERGQLVYTGGIPNKSNGEAGYGIYAYQSKSASMRRYYTANGEKVVSITPKNSARIADLTTLDARKDIVNVARKMSSNGKTTATVSTVQRHPWAVRTYLNEHPADAYLLPHRGNGVPTGKQLVIINEDAFYFVANNENEPTATNSNSVLMFNVGENMNKSPDINPEWLRYYLATKLSGRNKEIAFNTADFLSRVNSDLVGKYVNIARRAAGFIVKRFKGKMGKVSEDFTDKGVVLLNVLRRSADDIAGCYEAREYAKALREVMVLADRINTYMDQNKLWELAKQESQEARLHEVCTVCVEAFRVLTVYLKPVLPILAGKIEVLLNVSPLTFADVATPLLVGHTINGYQNLLQRMNAKQLDALFQQLEPVAMVPVKSKTPEPTAIIAAAQALGISDTDLINSEKNTAAPSIDGFSLGM